MRKTEFYDVFGAGFRKSCVGCERDPRKHGDMRRMLSAAFSQRALLEQEGVVGATVDKFVEAVGQRSIGQGEVLNMTKWYEMITFDTIGEMAFGESFHSIESGTLSKPHPPIKTSQNIELLTLQVHHIFGQL